MAGRGSLQGGEADGSGGSSEAAPLLPAQQQQQAVMQQDTYLTSRQEALHQVGA